MQELPDAGQQIDKRQQELEEQKEINYVDAPHKTDAEEENEEYRFKTCLTS